MRICKPHWQVRRDAVESRGMMSLVSADGEEALDRTVDELKGGDTKKNFDPLMSMHWHFTNLALEYGGLYLMGTPEDGSNDGNFCPFCEFEKHNKEFIPKEQIEKVADEMRAWCLEEKLIPAIA